MCCEAPWFQQLCRDTRTNQYAVPAQPNIPDHPTDLYTMFLSGRCHPHMSRVLPSRLHLRDPEVSLRRRVQVKRGERVGHRLTGVGRQDELVRVEPADGLLGRQRGDGTLGREGVKTVWTGRKSKQKQSRCRWSRMNASMKKWRAQNCFS